MRQVAQVHQRSTSGWQWPMVVALAFVTALGGLSVRQFLEVNRIAADVTRSRAVTQAVDQLLMVMVDAEAGYRGYLVTGDPVYLEPYRRADKRAAQALRSLATLLADAREGGGPTGMAALVNAKFDHMAAVLRRYDAGDRAVASSGMLAEGKRLMDDLRRRVRDLQERERAGAEAREAMAARALMAGRGFGLATLVVALLLAGVGGSLGHSLVATARDITDHRRVEEERANLLARERVARSDADRAARAKEELVSTLSHELRTPLNAILGWVGVLERDQSPETLRKAIDVIDRNSRRQSQMIDQLLDQGRITSGKRRPVDAAVQPFASLLDGLHVLVVDDEEDARDVVTRLLRDAGAIVTAAGSAREGLSLLASGLAADIIVSDVGMPDQDGYDFIRDVRRLDRVTAHAPAAALTARARLEDRTRAMMAGFQTHLAKPVDPSELVATVASLGGRTGRSAPAT